MTISSLLADKTQGVMRNRIKDRWAAWIGDEDVQAFDSYYVCR
jgi:hypothetical protein